MLKTLTQKIQKNKKTAKRVLIAGTIVGLSATIFVLKKKLDVADGLITAMMDSAEEIGFTWEFETKMVEAEVTPTE